MPNLEKESQSHSTSADDGQQLSHADMAKLVDQRLESLRRAGLTHLPKGTGEYAFEPSQLSQPQSRLTESAKVAQPEVQPNQQPAPAQPAVSDAPESGQTSTGVKETGTQYQPQPGASHPVAAASTSPPAVAAQPVTAQPVASQAVANATSANGPAALPDLAVDAYGPSLQVAQRISALKVLQDEVARCTKCDELASTRSQTVFGVGDPSARLVLLGEGPGAEEDRVGEPFVGAAGQLLDKIISACTLSRSDVYILNTVKCRPPGNRNPSQGELANCWGHAERQLEILQPEFICCLGSVAARTLLKTTLSIGKLRRQFHSYRGSQVLVTYHPAYLLRTPSAKKHVWEDMKFLMQEMGIDLPK